MWDWIGKLKDISTSGEAAVLVTVVKCAGSTPRSVGAKMLVLRGGEVFGTIGGGKLELLAIEEAKRCFADPTPKTSLFPLCIKTGQCCGGSVEVLMEVINQGPRLYLFGAGHVGQAVCQTLTGTPFHIHLIDERAAWLHAAGLPPGVIKHQESWQDFFAKAEWDKAATYVSVMTHSHAVDEDIIAAAVEKPARFIGLIGSKTKWDRFQMRLQARGIDQDALNRVACPLGIDIGGKAPKEVAISLAAQLLKIYHEH